MQTFLFAELTIAISAAILAAHRRLQRWFFRSVLWYLLASTIFCDTFSVYINGAYDVRSPADAFFLGFLSPPHFFYLTYGKVKVVLKKGMKCDQDCLILYYL